MTGSCTSTRPRWPCSAARANGSWVAVSGTPSSPATATRRSRARHGSWEWDVIGNRITWSEELRRICGLGPDEFSAPLDGYLELVHPADRSMVQYVMQQALKRGGSFAFEYRVMRPDGAVRTMHGRGE